MSDKILLQVSDLTIEIPQDGTIIRPVSNVSFSLKQGEILALVGESGAGKSITAASLLQLFPTTSATIKHGKALFSRRDNTSCDLYQLNLKERCAIRGSEIAMIFQEARAALNPLMTIGKQITEAIHTHQDKTKEEAKKIAITHLNEVQIHDPENCYNAYPHQLSGGMCQRVLITMALCSNPSLLIADEPTTALDVTVQAQILRLLDELRCHHQMSILLITHDLGIVAEIADSVAVLYQGNIVEYADVFTLFDQPQHDYTKLLLKSLPKGFE